MEPLLCAAGPSRRSQGKRPHFSRSALRPRTGGTARQRPLGKTPGTLHGWFSRCCTAPASSISVGCFAGIKLVQGAAGRRQRARIASIHTAVSACTLAGLLLGMPSARVDGHLAGVVTHAAVLVRERVQHWRHDFCQQRIVLLLKANSGSSQAQQPTFPTVSLCQSNESGGSKAGLCVSHILCERCCGSRRRPRLRRQRKVCDQPIDDRRDCFLPRTGPGEPLDDLLDLEGRCARACRCEQLAGIWMWGWRGGTPQIYLASVARRACHQCRAVRTQEAAGLTAPSSLRQNYTRG